MESIRKWSQNIWLSVVLFIVGLILSCLLINKTGAGFTVIITTFSLFIMWGISRAMKLQNATFSSALFLLGVQSIVNTIILFVSIPSLRLLLGILILLIPFALAKSIYQTSWGRAIWFIILNAVIVVVIISLSLKFLGPSSLTFIKKQADLDTVQQIQKTSVDQNKVAEAKALFPANFPLPANDAIIAAKTRQAAVVNDQLTLPGGAEITYISQEETRVILDQYTAAMTAVDLKVVTRPSHSADTHIIAGNKVKKLPTGVEVLDDSGTGIHEIGVQVLELGNGTKKVDLWLNL